MSRVTEGYLTGRYYSHNSAKKMLSKLSVKPDWGHKEKFGDNISPRFRTLPHIDAWCKRNICHHGDCVQRRGGTVLGRSFKHVKWNTCNNLLSLYSPLLSLSCCRMEWQRKQRPPQLRLADVIVIISTSSSLETDAYLILFATCTWQSLRGILALIVKPAHPFMMRVTSDRDTWEYNVTVMSHSYCIFNVLQNI